MTSIQLVFPINKMNNTHSFYSPSLEEYIQVNDNEFEDIRSEEIELRALELLSTFLDKYFSYFLNQLNWRLGGKCEGAGRRQSARSMKYFQPSI